MLPKIKQQLQKFNHSFSDADFQEFALQLKGRSGRDIDQITNELKDIEMALLEKAEYYLPVLIFVLPILFLFPVLKEPYPLTLVILGFCKTSLYQT